MTRRCKILMKLRVVTISAMLISSGGAAVVYAQTPSSRQRDDKLLEQIVQAKDASANNTEKISSLKETIKIQEDRIRSLEDSRNRVYGAFAFVTLVFALMNGYMLMLQVREHMPEGKHHNE